MLQVKHVTMVHRKDLRTILEDFQMVLNPGDKAVIIGEEGNGKSTLLKWIYDAGLVEDYVEVTGERIMSGERLGYLPQELPEGEREKSVYEYFSEEPSFFEMSPGELHVMAKQWHLSPELFYSEQKLGTLSGGERIKVQLARMLMASPTVLLLDEPSNDLDLAALEWLERFLTECPWGVLYVSHDELLIERTATMVVHLEQLRRKTTVRYTVAHLPYKEYIERRSVAMEEQRKQAGNERRQEQIRKEKYDRIRQKVERAQANVSRQEPHVGQLLKKKMKAVKAMEYRYEREAQNRTEMPETEEAIYLRFDGATAIPAGKTVLDLHLDEMTVPEEDGEARVLARNISLFVRGSEKVCIMGRNGIGKSTLIRRIADMLSERKDLRAVYMPQNYEESLDMSATPVEYLAATGNREELTRVRTYLGSMKYTADETEHPIRELSGGQRAKLFLLKISLSGANVLILDEPTRNFSPLSNPVLREVLSNYRGAIISVSHDRKYMDEVCETVYELTEEGLRKVRSS